MQPQNPNPDQNPFSNQPQQPGQPGSGPFHRRPVQPIAPRPYAAPQTPAPQPQQFRPPAPAQPQPISAQPAPQPAAPRPQPQQPPALSSPRPVAPQPQPQQPFKPQNIQAPAVPRQPQGSFGSPAAAVPQTDVRPRSAADINPDDMFTISDNRMQRSLPRTSRFPKGVFVVIAIAGVAMVVGILDKSQHNMVFNTLVAMNLLLALGLLVRKELVRKVAMGFAIATVTLSAALVLSYRGLTDNTVKAEAMFIEEAKKLQNQSPTKQLTHEQQQHLDAMQLKLEAQQSSLGESSSLVYGKYGATIALYALVALYLTRPKVKEAFAPIQK